MTPRRLIILGSTGSIGVQTLDIVSAYPERLQVVGLAANRGAELLAAQAREFGVSRVALCEPRAAEVAESLLPGATVFPGHAGLSQLVAETDADLVVGAISGVAGLASVLTALQRGLSVALANKEPLVAAGALVMQTARRSGARVIPLDSEISAIFQCLQGEDRHAVEKVLLTASGGPFAKLSTAELERVTPAQALQHPTWKMGPKVTIDSATLANKGFEVFELKWLFDLDFSQIEVLVHHQSIIHSAVQFCDGSMIAQMGVPDMRVPIQYGLLYPERIANDLPRADLAALGQLTFAKPDLERFPNLRLAFEVGRAGRSYPAVLNGANEAAVQLFLEERIGFRDIPAVSERALEAHEPFDVDSLDDVARADHWAREHVTTRRG